MTTTSTIKDARKYVTDTGANLPIVWAEELSQGNFRSFEAVNSWLLKNKSNNARVIIRGLVHIPVDAVMSYQGKVVFEGEGNTTAVINTPSSSTVTFANCEFRDIGFDNGSSSIINVNTTTFKDCSFIQDITITINGNDVTFENVDFQNQTIFTALNNRSNIQFKNCVLNDTTLLSFTSCNNIIFNNTNITSNLSIGTTSILLSGCTNVTFTGGSLTGNFTKGVNFSNSSFITFENFSTTTTLTASSGFNASDLVNTGNGNLYCGISSNIKNIVINNCSFTFSGTAATRFSFINIEFLGLISLTNLKIENNNFFTTANVEDKRAAISIIDGYSGGNSTSVSAALINANISENNCDKNQSIIITSQLVTVSSNPTMTYTGLQVQNCNISNNFCGAIGYWVSTGTLGSGFITSKESSLVINDNTCHLIYSSDSTGAIFLASASVNNSQFPSGNVLISNNKCNWIHTGLSNEEHSSLKIFKNNLNAYDQTYLSDYGETSSTIFTNAYEFSLIVTTNLYTATVSDPGISNDSQVIISENIVNQGFVAATDTYSYLGYLYCQSSAIINDNIYKGIKNDSTNAYALKLEGLNYLIQGNKFYRKSNSISSYITYTGAATTSKAIIIGNFFDNSNSSGTNLDIINTTIPVNWIIEKNINQIKYAIIPQANEMKIQGSTADYTNSGVYDNTFAGVKGFLPTDGNILEIFDFEDGTNPAIERFYSKQFNLKSYIPTACKILNVKMNCYMRSAVSTIDTTAFSTFALTLTKSQDPTTMLDVRNLSLGSPSPIADSVAATPFIVTAPNAILLAANNQSLNIDSSALSYYITDKYDCNVSFNVNWTRAATPGANLDLVFSSIVVKYTW